MACGLTDLPEENPREVLRMHIVITDWQINKETQLMLTG